ncbi:MAG: CvpA family protein [Acidobacteria bacterium]|nr:CvpA family protein [Acidobacteriota bacterium]
MNAVDYIIIAVMVLSILAAMAQGFLREALSVAGVVAGYVLAAWMYGRVSGRIAPYVNRPWLADLAAFLLIFFGVAFLAGVAGKIAHWGAKTAGLRWADRLLGGAFGLVRGGLVVVVVLLGLTAFQPNTPLLTNSQLAPYFLVVGRGAMWLAPSAVRQQFRAGIAALHRFEEQH